MAEDPTRTDAEAGAPSDGREAGASAPVGKAGKPKKDKKSKKGDKKRKQKRGGGEPATTGDRGDQLLTMAEAIERLKTTRATFYRWLRSGRIQGLKVGRQWRFRPADLERFLAGEQPRVDLPVSIQPLMKTLGSMLEEAGASAEQIAEATDADPVVEAAKLMLVLAAAARGTDLHLGPHAPAHEPHGTADLRLRIDGRLYRIATFDLRLLPPLVAAFKRMAGCDVHLHDRPQDGRMSWKLADRELQCRLCFVPAYGGEAVTARLIEPAQAAVALDRLGYPAAELERVREQLRHPAGLMLAVGPAGSGKTTLLYAMLRELCEPAVKAMTVEDPVEYAHPDVVQMQVNAKAGLSYAAGLRAAMRSDADVVMVGELTGPDPLEMMLKAAETGHRVLTAMQTDDAATTLRRLVDIGVDPLRLGGSLRLIVAQRLVRVLASRQSEPAQPDPADLARAKALAEAGGLDASVVEHGRFRRPITPGGLARTGYRGRTAICEVLTVTEPIVQALRDGASTESLRAVAVEQGMTTLAAQGIRLAAEGRTTLRDVFAVLPH